MFSVVCDFLSNRQGSESGRHEVIAVNVRQKDCVSLCVYAHGDVVPVEPEGHTRCGVGVIGGCELPDVILGTELSPPRATSALNY